MDGSILWIIWQPCIFILSGLRLVDSLVRLFVICMFDAAARMQHDNVVVPWETRQAFCLMWQLCLASLKLFWQFVAVLDVLLD